MPIPVRDNIKLWQVRLKEALDSTAVPPVDASPQVKQILKNWLEYPYASIDCTCPECNHCGNAFYRELLESRCQVAFDAGVVSGFAASRFGLALE